MDVEPSVRGRLNLLVQMFENRSKAEEDSCPESDGCRRLPSSRSRLSLSLRERVIQENSDPFAKTPLSSVDKLIKAFDVQPDAQSPRCFCRKCQGGANVCQRNADLPGQHCQGFPEVHALVMEIFDRIQQRHREPASSDLECRLMDSKAEALSTSEVSAEPRGDGEKIGAMWTHYSSPFLRCQSETRCFGIQMCTEQLSQYINLFGSQLTSAEIFRQDGSPTDVHKDAIKRVMNQISHDTATREDQDYFVGISVRVCRALIEMMICVEEDPPLTVNMTNRAPRPLADEGDIIFSTDDLAP